MATSRREFLLKAVDVAQLKGLEIGPLNKPLVNKEDMHEGGEIFYLDHLPTKELKDKYKDDKSVSIDEIVSVDFVCRDGDIIKATSGNTFDYGSFPRDRAFTKLLGIFERYSEYIKARWGMYFDCPR